LTFADECPTSLGYMYVPDANVCYRPMNDFAGKLIWLQARLACETDGGHLYIGNTARKSQIVHDYIMTNSMYY
jgi:hypothetical protein